MDKAKEQQDAWDKKDRAREAAATAAMMTERGMSQFMTEFHVNSMSRGDSSRSGDEVGEN
jgi:hypothetical protein